MLNILRVQLCLQSRGTLCTCMQFMIHKHDIKQKRMHAFIEASISVIRQFASCDV